MGTNEVIATLLLSFIAIWMVYGSVQSEHLLRRLGHDVPDWPVHGTTRPGTGTCLQGLFVGGTLKAEAEVLVAAAGLDAELLDFGDDEYTAGRAHPMTDEWWVWPPQRGPDPPLDRATRSGDSGVRRRNLAARRGACRDALLRVNYGA